MRIEVHHCPRAGDILQVTLDLPVGTTVEQALLQLPSDADWATAVAATQSGAFGVSLWSRRVGLGEVLRDGDRLELSRPLVVDPKVARRERFKGQGSKTAGLFSKKRPGAKAGY